MASVFSHLILDVQDIDRSLAFYHGLLNLPVREEDSMDGHRLAYLITGKTEIILLQQPIHEQNPELERKGAQMIKFHVKDLPDVAHHLNRHHVQVLRDLEYAIYGERTLLVADPDGYAVLLSESVETIH